MKKKWLLFLVIIALLAGVAVWVNMRNRADLPDGFVGGNGRMELKRLDVATLYAEGSKALWLMKEMSLKRIRF